MKKIISLLLAMLLLFSFTACRKKTDPNNSPATDTDITDVTPETSTDPDDDKDLADNSDDLSKTEDETPAVSVLIDRNSESYSDDETGMTLLYSEYPSITVTAPENKAAADNINSALEASISAFTEEAAAAVEISAEDYLFNPESWMEYGYYRSASLPYIGSNSLCVVFNDSVNTGGAHPNSYTIALCFDLETGESISFSSLSENTDLLTETIRNHIVADIAAQWPAEYFYPDYTENIDLFISDNWWYFSEEGLVFICNPYIIAPYAMGTLTFTVPYSDLDGILLDKWMPAETSHTEPTEEIMQISEYDEADISAFERVDSIILSGNGTKIVLSVSEAVTNIHIDRVTYSETAGFEISSAAYASSSLTPSDALVITAVIPESIPDLAVSYTTSDGATVTRYISQSGADGSLMLISEQ